MKISQFLSKPRLTGMAAIVLTVGMMALTGLAYAQRKPAIVIFNANWCASCRQINPIAQEIANQNNVPVVLIDVDAPNAPDTARNYGLTIVTSELPQIYYVGQGRATLLYGGEGYKYGRNDAIRAAILQKLQEATGR